MAVLSNRLAKAPVTGQQALLLRCDQRRVLAALRRQRIPVALSMAGGYGRDLATTVAIQRRTLAEALGSWQSWHRGRAVEECAP